MLRCLASKTLTTSNNLEKVQEPMMKRINKPFEEVLARLVQTDPKEVNKLKEKDLKEGDKAPLEQSLDWLKYLIINQLN